MKFKCNINKGFYLKFGSGLSDLWNLMTAADEDRYGGQ
jgi:hypothetical protein